MRSQTLSESNGVPEQLVLDALLQYVQQRTDRAKQNLVTQLSRLIATSYQLGGDRAGKEVGQQGRLGLQGLDPIIKRVGDNLDSTFSDMSGELTDIIKNGISNGQSYSTVQKLLVDKIGGGWGKDITFDSVGTVRKVVRVSPRGALRTKSITISQPVTISTDAYADTLARTTMKQAYSAGHFARYQTAGYPGWVYISVADERTRPWHLALHGRVFLFGTPEEEMARKVMGEYNCRVSAKAWFDDPKLDTDPLIYAKQRVDWAQQHLDENPAPEPAEFLQKIINAAPAAAVV